MDPELVREVTAWRNKSELDLRAADSDLAASPPLIEDALFHCQQSVEKTLKAFLVAHSIPFRKTHDLDELTTLAEQIDPGMRLLLDPVLAFSVFAWIFRYPAETETPSDQEARASLNQARAACDAIRQKIPIPQS